MIEIKKKWKSLLFFLIGIVIVFAGMIWMWYLVWYYLWWQPEGVWPEMYSLFALQSLLSLGLLFFALYYWWVKGRANVNEYFADRWRVDGVWWIVKWVILPLVIYFVGMWLLYAWLDMYDVQVPGLFWEQEMVSMLKNLDLTSNVAWVMAILMIVVVGPLVEELVFRAYLTDIFMSKWWVFWVLLVTFFFTFVHVEWAVFWNIFIISTVLWIVYYNTKSYAYTFLIHVVINWLALLALWLWVA